LKSLAILFSHSTSRGVKKKKKKRGTRKEKRGRGGKETVRFLFLFHREGKLGKKKKKGGHGKKKKKGRKGPPRMPPMIFFQSRSSE